MGAIGALIASASRAFWGKDVLRRVCFVIRVVRARLANRWTMTVFAEPPYASRVV